MTAVAIFPVAGSAFIQNEETIAIQDTYISLLEHDDVHGSEANVRAGLEPFVFPFPLPIGLLPYEGFFKFDLSFDESFVENATKVKIVLPITGSARSGGSNKEMIFDRPTPI